MKKIAMAGLLVPGHRGVGDDHDRPVPAVPAHLPDDPERGLLVHEVYDMALDLTLTMSSADEEPERDPMVMDIDSESRTVWELLEE